MNRLKAAFVLLAFLAMGISSVYACPLHSGGNGNSETEEEGKPAQA